MSNLIHLLRLLCRHLRYFVPYRSMAWGKGRWVLKIIILTASWKGQSFLYCFDLQLLMYGSKLSNSLFNKFVLQFIHENVRLKFSLYCRKCLFQALAVSSDNWPIRRTAWVIISVPCIKIVCMGCRPYRSIYLLAVSWAKTSNV